MNDPKQPAIGSIVWRDLTVGSAAEIRDFCAQVVGWSHTDHDMGDYVDYNMNDPNTEETQAGICHA